MKNLNLKLFFLVSACSLFACDKSNFSGDSDKKTNSATAETKPSPSVTPAVTPPVSGDSVVVTNDLSKCWFMVSGAQFGWSSDGGESYNSAFPKTSSGNPIKGGETFDTVGGIYLNARPEPYIYASGGKEIDAAVDNTFDSIAVAPGMSVEIRTSENGAIMYQGNGPYVAISNNYDNFHGNGATNYASLMNRIRPLAKDMPDWMRTKFEAANFVVPRLSLHDAKWVKVTKLPNVACE